MNRPADVVINQSIAPIAAYQVFVQLEERARAAKTTRELIFSLANETWQLSAHRSSFVFDLNSNSEPKLRAVSGVAQLGEDSPFTVYLKRLGAWIKKRHATEAGAFYLNVGDVPDALKAGWEEWLPSFLFVAPVHYPEGASVANAAPGRQATRALVAFAVEDGFDDIQAELIQRLMDAYGHAWEALESKRNAGVFSSGALTGKWAGIRRWLLPLAAALALAAMFIPIRLSVLAGAEVIALDAAVVSAPIEGVIKTFHVAPNQTVVKGQPLFTLDETSLKNRREVAFKQLQVARADAMSAQQKSFENENSRADMASLNGRVAERQAELASVEDQLKRIIVLAPNDGVVVFGDVNDWLGKPVNTGERVALLADPKDAGLLIWLPVSEAINLDVGANIKLYLQIAPLKPLAATLTQTSYQAVLSPEGISAYRLRAQLQLSDAQEQSLARIGLKGTAKLYGEKAPLGYYLFRRPLSALRELTGW